ncbi:thioesterase II family protein [Streptomyces sp. YIM S03343]
MTFPSLSPSSPVQRTELWFRCFERRPYAVGRIYAFPFAGGGAAVYRGWVDRLPASVELRAAQLPGRQDRMAEPPVTDLAELVRTLADILLDDLADLDHGPFAFFGHSMGALLSFELARELRRRGGPLPVLLGLSGWSSPRGGLPHERYSGLSDQQFLFALRRLGGMPQDVLNAPELLRLVLPTLRADFAVVESHTYRQEPPLRQPMSVFGGISDPFTERRGIEEWRHETTAPVTARHYPGKHFFLLEEADAVAVAFAGDLSRALTGGGVR